MPRIPDTEIDRIKRETDLAALVRARGVELKKHGGNGHLVGKCPFHAEDTASFIVTPAKGLFHCMGCGTAGNAIQFLEKFDGVSFRHAFELLNDGAVAFTAPPKGHVKRTTVPRLAAPVKPDAEDAEIFAQVVDYYHERLLSPSGSAARDYLKQRGLDDETALRAFRIGFADRTLGLRLPYVKSKNGAALRSRLRKLGLIRESGHEHFNGSIVLPVFDSQGCVVEMYGRKINRHQTKGTPKHLYLPGPHAGIWNAEALDTGEVILCEAPLDALTFRVNGIRNVTFIYGTEGFPDWMLDALIERRVKTVRLAYDADGAGNRAAERDAERLAARGVECYRIKFPWGMDVNEYAIKVTPAAKSLATAVQSAEWLGSLADQPSSHARAQAPSSLSLAANLAAKEKTAAEDSPSEICANPCMPRRSPAKAGMPRRSPAKAGPSAVKTPSLERLGEYHTLALGSRQYRVGGLEKNNSLEVMKVAVRLRHGEDFHLDSFDLCRDGERRRFIERAAEETGLEKDLVKRDLGKLLLALEREQEARLAAAVEPSGKPVPSMTADERKEALEFLTAPDLAERIGEAFDICGLVGEETNRLAAYLACTSRKLDRPLAVIVQSTSAAGKSALMEAALAMFPEEERVKYSAMTGQSLYYLGETSLKHKILAIVEEEGAEKAGYALKLLQSEGELTIASTGKDPHTGRMETQEYRVEGPVAIFLTTTAVEIDEELLNRCLVLTVDESREQTARIHALQRQARTLEGLRLKKRKDRTLRVLRNAQRLLEPLDVVNPWADRLTFTAERTRTRRDHEKYLTLIDAIALLHQRRRPRETVEAADSRTGEAGQFIRVTLDDIALANRIAPELLGRSLDELPPQTRQVYETVKAVVRERMDAEEIEQPLALFSRREIRDRLGWSITQVRAHLERLRDMEFVAARFGRPGSPFQYELLTDCREPAATDHIGLLDVEKLRVSAKLPSEDVRLRLPTCREKRPPVGGCRNAPRQVQTVEEQRFAVNLSACRDRASGPAAVAEA